MSLLPKKRAYEPCINEIKHSVFVFTPLVFSSPRGIGHEVTIFCQKLQLACYLINGKNFILQYCIVNFCSAIAQIRHTMYQRRPVFMMLLHKVFFRDLVLNVVVYPIPKHLCCKKGKDKKVQVTERSKHVISP